MAWLRASGVRALARGDLRLRVPVESRDEFAELAGRIDGMAEDVEAHVEALQASETRFRLAARAASDITGDRNVRTGEVVWNEVLDTVGGYRAEEVGGTVEEAWAWWSAHVHPEDRHVLDDFQDALASGRETWSAEYRVRWPDGTCAAVLGRTLVARDAVGQPVRVVAALLDISERKRAEQRGGLAGRAWGCRSAGRSRPSTASGSGQRARARGRGAPAELRRPFGPSRLAAIPDRYPCNSPSPCGSGRGDARWRLSRPSGGSSMSTSRSGPSVRAPRECP